MPRISSFYGIAIYMYFDDHGPPHFHATYGGRSARFEIGSLEPMDEGFPLRALRLVQDWGVLHREELQENWERAAAHAPLARIEPLR